MDNDANVGALGESLFGAGTRHAAVLHDASTGIGGGIVIDGKVSIAAPIPMPAKSAT